MSKYVKIGDLQVAGELVDFIDSEALPGSQVIRMRFGQDLKKSSLN